MESQNTSYKNPILIAPQFPFFSIKQYYCDEILLLNPINMLIMDEYGSNINFVIVMSHSQISLLCKNIVGKLKITEYLVNYCYVNLTF